MRTDTEIDFEPPHGLEVFDVTYDGATLSFLTETGRSVTMRGEMRFFSTKFRDDEDIPLMTSGIFYGIYEADDFRYPVEVHFTNTHGYIFERPRSIPECIMIIECCVSYVYLCDPTGQSIVCVRDPYAPWEPEKGRLYGRIGHLLFWL